MACVNAGVGTNVRTVSRKLCRRYDDPGHAHYLTFTCFHNQRFLSGGRAPAWFIESLDSARQRRPFDLWAFVIMPEHVHLLLWPHERVGISAVLAAIKIPVTRRAVAAARENPDLLAKMADLQPNGSRCHRFWQRGGGYDRNLWTPQEIHEKITYIHNNPVRRGLAVVAEDWPWSSARAWQQGEDAPIRLDRDTLPQIMR